MKTTNPIISFFSSLLFLKEYNFNEEKLRIIKNRFPYFLAICVLFILLFILPFPDFLIEKPIDNGLFKFIFLFFFFAIYHWFFLIYISKFAKRHIAYLVLFLPLIYYFSKNLILWNKPTYYGAMEGFSVIATMEEQLLMFVLFPTFLFALRMVKIENPIKGIVLILIATISAIIGIEQCIGKEGYLADDMGSGFAGLIILLLVMAVYLIKFSSEKHYES
jgi:hypothetical protein